MLFARASWWLTPLKTKVPGLCWCTKWFGVPTICGEHIVHIDGGKPPRTASGGNLVGGFLMRNKRSPRCGVAPIEHAGVGSSPTVTTTAQPLKIKGCNFLSPGITAEGCTFFRVHLGDVNSSGLHSVHMVVWLSCRKIGVALLVEMKLPL